MNPGLHKKIYIVGRQTENHDRTHQQVCSGYEKVLSSKLSCLKGRRQLGEWNEISHFGKIINDCKNDSVTFRGRKAGNKNSNVGTGGTVTSKGCNRPAGG